MDKLHAIEILLVEDNLRDAELMLRSLSKNNLANNVMVIHDGAEALDFFFCKGKYASRDPFHPPRVVFLDLKLPKLSGLELLKIVKSDKRTSNIPVVVVTSSREAPDVQKAFDLGANSYVVKPVDFDQFSSAIVNLGMYWLILNETIK